MGKVRGFFFYSNILFCKIFIKVFMILYGNSFFCFFLVYFEFFEDQDYDLFILLYLNFMFVIKQVIKVLNICKMNEELIIDLDIFFVKKRYRMECLFIVKNNFMFGLVIIKSKKGK